MDLWDSGDFIPLAEYLGLITSIGDYVLEEACRQCRYWNEHCMPDFHINVNLSVVQLLQKDIVDTVAKVLKKTGVNPRISCWRLQRALLLMIWTGFLI